MRPIKCKRMWVPVKFHSILKLEAYKNGQTMTKYMEKVVKDMDIKKISSFEEYMRIKENEKKKKSFKMGF